MTRPLAGTGGRTASAEPMRIEDSPRHETLRLSKTALVPLAQTAPARAETESANTRRKSETDPGPG
jgi:hypothetical protein